MLTGEQLGRGVKVGAPRLGSGGGCLSVDSEGRVHFHSKTLPDPTLRPHLAPLGRECLTTLQATKNLQPSVS